eukprot:TRINITY_DN15721_c0_g3_i2.p1 TRINITY_DN15721_c0_g3~~TRINITY_DN15721_c0_g3_i2.p1  ORF type:complete len:680 (+),score=167.78 TRINITY_DN15721_c0_g3_i2:1024-3063(+)
MGCGASKTSQEEVEFGQAVVPTEPSVSEHNRTRKEKRKKDNPTKGDEEESKTHSKKNRRTSEDGEMPGKAKYFPVPLVSEAKDAKDGDGNALPGTYYISAFSHITDLKGLTIAVREPEGTVHAIAFSDSELHTYKAENALKHSWMSFFRALNNAFARGHPKVKRFGAKIQLETPLTNTKEPKHQQFNLELNRIGNGFSITHQYFMEPFTRFFAKQVHDGPKKPDGVEAKYWKVEGTLFHNREQLEQNLRQSKELEERLSKEQQESNDLKIRLDRAMRKLQRMQSDTSNHLDQLYTIGGARTFTGHIAHAISHEPCEIQPDPMALSLIEAKYDRDAESVSIPNEPNNRDGVDLNELMEVLQKIDKWDFSVFALDTATKGSSLFHTAYALFHKYGLMDHFAIPKDVLIRFLIAVQSGYRPNSYHNSVHAADVLHITHFLLSPAGLAKLAQLSMEDKLAVLLAAAIHDYDHPGFNNNFHTRTTAYLATLYSDKSILENHHCACVFEMMFNPKLDILGTLSEDQKREVRETIIELVLSTDMGNHAKLFSSFRRRLNESDDWVSKREDARLAMMMAIKTADISNCGRPAFLYLKWARNIADEFYVQGDVEQMVKLPVSPFMDRRKDSTDFSKGQISFINFIVIPLFESIAELLPDFEFAVQHCHENRESWISGANKGSGIHDKM